MSTTSLIPVHELQALPTGNSRCFELVLGGLHVKSPSGLRPNDLSFNPNTCQQFASTKKLFKKHWNFLSLCVKFFLDHASQVGKESIRRAHVRRAVHDGECVGFQVGQRS